MTETDTKDTDVKTVTDAVIADRRGDIDYSTWGLQDYLSLAGDVAGTIFLTAFVLVIGSYALGVGGVESTVVRLSILGGFGAGVVLVGTMLGAVGHQIITVYSRRWDGVQVELEDTDRDCPSCGAKLKREVGFERMYRCSSCRFEGMETPTYRLYRWIRERVR